MSTRAPTPKFKASVCGVYDKPGGLKPRALYQAPPTTQPSMMDDYLMHRPS